MNRREALSTLAAALVPTWNFRESSRIARPVPLHEFCEPFATSIRFDMTHVTPFVKGQQAIAFRFDGGVGLLMPLKTDMARNSIRAANG